MVKIKGRVFKIGNSYAIRVRKVLVDAEVLKNGEEYELELKPQHNSPEVGWQDHYLLGNNTTLPA